MRHRTPIDWDAVHARLEGRRAAMEKAAAPGSEQIKEAYRRRAASLAKEGDLTTGAPEVDALVVFHLGAERYGIELRRVQEIVAHPRLAPVPGAPPRVAGVMQVRGDIRPVWELTRILGVPDLNGADPGVVLLVRTGKREIGLRASRVETIRALDPEERAAARAAGGRRTTADLVTILLDIDEILNEEA